MLYELGDGLNGASRRMDELLLVSFLDCLTVLLKM
jgi:hypothetical protein